MGRRLKKKHVTEKVLLKILLGSARIDIPLFVLSFVRVSEEKNVIHNCTFFNRTNFMLKCSNWFFVCSEFSNNVELRI